jgi:hypothetical protein
MDPQKCSVAKMSDRTHRLCAYNKRIICHAMNSSFGDWMNELKSGRPHPETVATFDYRPLSGESDAAARRV